MKTIYLFASLTVCIWVSSGAFGQKTTSCGVDVTNLSLTVELGGYAILPDGVNTPYKTGKVKGDTIDGKFQLSNCSQDYTLNLGGSARYMAVNFPNPGGSYQAKFYNFDRVASVPITTDTNFITSQFCTNGADPAPNGFVVTKNSDGTYRDNYAGCGTDVSGNFVRRAVGISLKDLSSTADYRLHFQRSPLDGGISQTVIGATTYIKVYHPDGTTWVLEPEGGDDPSTVDIVETTYAPGAKVEWLNGFILRGVYHMPFRFTLRKF